MLQSQHSKNMKNNRQIKIIFPFITITFLSLFLNAKLVHADTTLSVFPPIVQVDATPPSNINTVISVANESNDPVDVDVVIKPFVPSGNHTGEIKFLNSDEGFAGNDALILQKVQVMQDDNPVKSLTLAPQQVQNLVLHVALPQEEPPSDYYFSILFVPKGQPMTGETSSAISGAVGINVLLSIGPKDRTTGNIKEFSSPWLVDHGPLPITVDLQNTSNHFINPRSTILIKNMFGQPIGKVNLAPVNILSQSDRIVPDIDSSDNYAHWSEVFLLGPYSAILTTALSDEGPILTRTIYFFAMPIQFIIGAIIIVGITTLIIIRVRKRLKS